LLCMKWLTSFIVVPGASFTSTLRASTSSTNSAHLASALIDHSISSGGHATGPPRRMTTGPNFLSSSSFSPYENVSVSPSTGSYFGS
jgi:hypothetical protein